MRPSAHALAKREANARALKQSREVLLARSGGHCEARFSPACTGVGVTAHHKKLRSQGGGHDPENLVWTCDPCHSILHSHVAEARAAGLIVPSWEDQ